MPADPMRVQAVFLGAVNLPDPDARTAYLERACGEDRELRGRVDALLRAHDAPDSLLDEPLVSPVADTSAHPEETGAASEFSFLEPPKREGSLGRIGHYEVLEILGRGGFGIVFRAFDEALQRVVAVKVLAPHIAATSPARKRFLREARAAAQVRHENVVQVHAVVEQPLPYIVMEYVPGETLQQRMDRTGPLDALETVSIGRQIAAGLAAAHEKGLIHRDIKPTNILVDGASGRRVTITDFGLARAADDASLTKSGILAGTPMFMAPEQAKGEALDGRADLFSLGSVLYTMASGRPPFRASGTMAVLKRVCDEEPRPIREVIPETPEWLSRIIEKLHVKDPSQRFQSAGEVESVLADCERQLAATAEVKDFRRIPPKLRRSKSAARYELRNHRGIPMRERRLWHPSVWALFAVAVGLFVAPFLFLASRERVAAVAEAASARDAAEQAVRAAAKERDAKTTAQSPPANPDLVQALRDKASALEKAFNALDVARKRGSASPMESVDARARYLEAKADVAEAEQNLGERERCLKEALTCREEQRLMLGKMRDNGMVPPTAVHDLDVKIADLKVKLAAAANPQPHATAPQKTLPRRKGDSNPPVAFSDNGWMILYSGNDLVGWTQEVAAGSWQVTPEGYLKGTGIGQLFSIRTFDDFHLRARLRLSAGADTRFFFRCDPKKLQVGASSGFEAIVNLRDKGDPKTGSLFTPDGKHEPSMPPSLRAGEWFVYDIIAIGDLITLKVNDKAILQGDFGGSNRRPGSIGLQLPGVGKTLEASHVWVRPFPIEGPYFQKFEEPNSDVVKALREKVAAKKKLLAVMAKNFEAKTTSEAELVSAEIDRVEAEIAVAEAEHNRNEQIRLLAELCTHRQAERKRIEKLIANKAAPASALNEIDAKIADVKARQAIAKAEVR